MLSATAMCALHIVFSALRKSQREAIHSARNLVYVSLRTVAYESCFIHGLVSNQLPKVQLTRFET